MTSVAFRSVAYDLDESIDVARKLADLGGNGSSSNDLAQALGYTGANNGAFLTRLANARLFGVVTGHSSRLAPSERGTRALSENRSVAGRARIEAFLAVPLFRYLIDRYQRLPLPNAQSVEGAIRVEIGQNERKAKVSGAKFLTSARQAGLVFSSPDGTERLASSVIERSTDHRCDENTNGRIHASAEQARHQRPARCPVSTLEEGLISASVTDRRGILSVFDRVRNWRSLRNCT
jgi:hypothetical protein